MNKFTFDDSYDRGRFRNKIIRITWLIASYGKTKKLKSPSIIKNKKWKHQIRIRQNKQTFTHREIKYISVKNQEKTESQVQSH